MEIVGRVLDREFGRWFLLQTQSTGGSLGAEMGRRKWEGGNGKAEKAEKAERRKMEGGKRKKKKKKKK